METYNLTMRKKMTADEAIDILQELLEEEWLWN